MRSCAFALKNTSSQCQTTCSFKSFHVRRTLATIHLMLRANVASLVFMCLCVRELDNARVTDHNRPYHNLNGYGSVNTHAHRNVYTATHARRATFVAALIYVIFISATLPRDALWLIYVACIGAALPPDALLSLRSGPSARALFSDGVCRCVREGYGEHLHDRDGQLPHGADARASCADARASFVVSDAVSVADTVAHSVADTFADATTFACACEELGNAKMSGGGDGTALARKARLEQARHDGASSRLERAC